MLTKRFSTRSATLESVEHSLTADPAPEYTPGDSVMYRGDPENVWRVIHVERGVSCWWTRAAQNSVNQSFPANVFTRIERLRVAKVETPKVEKIEKQKPVTIETPKPDRIAALLAEARGLDEVIEIARLAGIDYTKDEARSPGLQRMYLGNLLRNKMKRGEFDPESIYWTGQGFAPRASPV